MKKTVNVNSITVMSTEDLALLLTAYERFGSLTESDLVEMLCDEFEITEDIISDYNEYLSNHYPDNYVYDDLDTMLEGVDPVTAAKMIYFGNVKNWCDDYFRFNGYGNIESLSAYELKKEIAADTDFLENYVRENILDDLDVNAIIANANQLVKEGY